MEKPELLRVDRQISIKENLTYYYNMFQDKLIAATIDRAHYERIQKDEPNFQTVMDGQTMKIDVLVKSQKKKQWFARENMRHIAELLKQEEAGLIEEEWNDEKVLEEIEQFEKSKEANKEEK